MIEVVGLRDRDTFSLGFTRTDTIKLQLGDQCLIKTQSGVTLATVVTSPRLVDERYLADNEPELLRKATADDLQKLNELVDKEQQARATCKSKIQKHRLQMKLIRVRCCFDQHKIIFYFVSDGRVDFRELVRDLAHEFKCRIEMRQVGVRDEARMLGGIGCCGKILCCSGHLRAFDPVSIRMAKEQGLTLIPSKISGVCGRLLCCLKYEYDSYMEVHRRVPRQGRKVMTPKGPGKIKQISVPKEEIRVELADGEEIVLPIPSLTYGADGTPCIGLQELPSDADDDIDGADALDEEVIPRKQRRGDANVDQRKLGDERIPPANADSRLPDELQALDEDERA